MTSTREHMVSLRRLAVPAQLFEAAISDSNELLSPGPYMRYPVPLFALVLASTIAACSHRDSQLDAIDAAVNGCVIDVRDKTSKYETSPNCRALSEIAKRYVAAGGLKQSAPCRADRIAESARARAWMALAVSKSGDPGLTIW